MTYLESYERCQSEEELYREVERDCHIALLLGNNPDRLSKIFDAAETVANSRDWFNPCNRM